MARCVSLVLFLSVVFRLQSVLIGQATIGNDQSQRRGELFSYNETTKIFSPYLSGISASYVEISPDRQWVAYISYPEGVLWRSKIDGSQRAALTHKPMNATLPHWSRDSQQIAFMATATPDQPWTIFISSPFTGGDPQQVLPKAGNEGDPSWSPDGQAIVYGFSGFANESPTAVALHRIDLKTRQVSDVPGSKGLFSPRWSPDGKYIAAIRMSNGSLMILDVAAGQWSEVCDKQVGWPAWTHDSEYIYLATGLATTVIWRVRVPDGQVEQVVSLQDVQGPPGPLPAWAGLAADGAPTFMRRLVTSEQAELLQVEKRLAEAITHQDRATADKLYSDDLVDTGVAGFVSSKEDDLSGLKSGPPLHVSLERMQASVYGDAGVVTGVGHARFAFEGKSYDQSWRFTDTLTRRNGEWRLVATQQTRIPEPFVRDVQDSELPALSPDSCDSESSLKSTSFEIPSFIRFVNRDAHPLKLYWINYQGKRDQERALAPSKPSDVVTFLGHPFVVADDAGKCVAVYRANADPGIAVIVEK